MSFDAEITKYRKKKRYIPPANPNFKFWFQIEGEWNVESAVWIPRQPLPLLFELPGMVNIFDRKDIDYFKDSGELQQIEQRYYYELWPRIPKSMREKYVEKERSSLRKFHDILWKQLRPIKDFTTSDILNNEFKLDFYGNVVSRHNERYSKTSWDVDHIFPFSRGGLSLIGNLRIVQSRANSVVKKDRIDTLIERKEMRIGISLKELQRLAGEMKKETLIIFLTTRDKKIQEEIDFHTDEHEKELLEYELLCSHCQKNESKFHCQDCKQYQFCSEQCHRENWHANNSVHRQLCK